MKNHVQDGRVLTVTAPTGGVSSGGGVMSGSLFGVAAFDAVEGAEVEVATEGVFELPKTTGTAWTVGLPIFWNNTTKKAAATGDLQIGVAVAAAGSSAAVGLVKIDPKPVVPAAAIADLAANADLPTAVAKINAILAGGAMGKGSRAITASGAMAGRSGSPRPSMQAAGFNSVPLGPDGPKAFQLAEEWNRRWDLLLPRRDAVPRHGGGRQPVAGDVRRADGLSAAFPRRGVPQVPPYQNGPARRRGPVRTGWRGWRRIKPVFGDCDPRTATSPICRLGGGTVEDTVSLREAHRAMKIWRALWKVAAALGYCVRDADPSLGIRNTAAAGRSATWSEGEAVRLFKQALRNRLLRPRRYHRGRLVHAAQPRRCPHASRVTARDGGRWHRVLRGAGQDREAGRRRADQSSPGRHGRLPRLDRGRDDRRGFHFSEPLRRPLQQGHAGRLLPRRAGRAVRGDGERRTLADFRRSGAVEGDRGGGRACRSRPRHGGTTPSAPRTHCLPPMCPSTSRRCAASWKPGSVAGRSSDTTDRAQKLERAGLKSWNVTDANAKARKSGGSDGARTRDLRRDRPAL